MTYAAATLIGRKQSQSGTGFQPARVAAKKPGIGSAVISYLLDHPYAIYAFARRFWPIVVIRGWAFISRYEDVIEVLKRQDVFAVPFGPKIELLNGGPNFLLGMADGADYRALHELVANTFPTSDNRAIVGPIAAEEAEALVMSSRGRIDAIEDLVTRVPTRICERYYGVAVPNETRFAHITIAMSTFMFGDPSNDPTVRDEAVKAGAELRPIIDAAIAGARAAPAGSDTIAARLVSAKGADGAPVPDETIRAILIGMITGFVPTNTMAGGHMLEMLLRRPDMMRATQAAARADDDELLKRCLWEAFRFLPLNPGPFRECAEDAIVAQGTRRAKRIPKGTKMLVSTHSAMFDPRRIERPKAFDPGRASHNNLTLGSGIHWCIGAPLAEAQIVQTLKPLLLQRNLRRAAGQAGRLALDGPFPAHLVVEFDPA
ncbi:MAG: cytochrome P450 [Sphingomonas sp.]|uniref:cytochrome P450 n=1 Tax=Sphingomonas sp. TaxID=28214 RepID=UPI0018058C1A|nr:cytochrome P450 [Sphingomonas sp.]MBA3666618.1 cytochrome P450 [Sphingomonas sp.]